jgi:hypothetical protein
MEGVNSTQPLRTCQRAASPDEVDFLYIFFNFGCSSPIPLLYSARIVLGYRRTATLAYQCDRHRLCRIGNRRLLF